MSDHIVYAWGEMAVENVVVYEFVTYMDSCLWICHMSDNVVCYIVALFW
jgi:hypothetical protein